MAPCLPVADDLGLKPWEFWALTMPEFLRLVDAEIRRRARAADERAWAVAHLAYFCGHVKPGVSVGDLMRALLGRELGTLPGAVEPEPMPPSAPAPAGKEMTPAESVAFAAHWVRVLGGRVELPPNA